MGHREYRYFVTSWIYGKKKPSIWGGNESILRIQGIGAANGRWERDRAAAKSSGRYFFQTCERSILRAPERNDRVAVRLVRQYEHFTGFRTVFSMHDGY